MGSSIGRAAVDDIHAADSGPPLVLYQDGLHGPGFGIEANLARGGVLFPAVAGAGDLRGIIASWPRYEHICPKLYVAQV
jgi:hypothetical protein